MQRSTTIHMPTTPEVIFTVPSEIKIPKQGEILNIKFEDFITDDDDWELALSALENDVMVVDRILNDHVWLREGNSA